MNRTHYAQPFFKFGCPKCKHLACVCEIHAEHEKRCKFLRAATCSTPIACDPHGRDTCPICDPCTCKRKRR